jgi:hypothetical protein
MLQIVRAVIAAAVLVLVVSHIPQSRVRSVCFAVVGMPPDFEVWSPA